MGPVLFVLFINDIDDSLSRVVNIAVLVLLPMLSAILFDYRHKYRRYFSFSIGIGIGNTFLPKYCYWYCQYFSQVLLTSLSISKILKCR